MKNKLVYIITSLLSILLAVFLLYQLIEEIANGISISEINPVAVFITLLILFNAVLSVILLAKRINMRRWVLIVQIVILVPTFLLIWNIFFNSTISCT